MVDLAAHLIDRVLPHVPMRQYVLSLPFRLRYLLAYDPAVCSRVRRIFADAVQSFVKARAKRLGIENGRTGAVTFTQRFDSAIRLNLHFHLIGLDGVYVRSLYGEPEFHELPTPSQEDIVGLTRRLHRRICRFLRKTGHLRDEDDDDPGDEEPSVHAACLAGAVQGRRALGPKAGAWTPRLGRDPTVVPVFEAKKLACSLDGFSLHAATRVGASSRARLEKLVRYMARPPLVNERLSLTRDGRVLYELKKRWKDGSSHVVFEPLAFLERLAALVPRPRLPLVTYHGVLAPASSWRDAVVPDPPPDSAEHEEPTEDSHEEPPPAPPPTTRHSRPSYSWAQLMHRVWKIDVLVCPYCGGKRRVLAFIIDPPVVKKILDHLGLATEAPHIAPARPPPQPEFDFA